MAVVDGLDAASAGDIVFADGYLHLAVVGHGQYILHQPFAVAALTDDGGTVEVLQASADYLAGRGRTVVDKYCQRNLGVLGCHTGVALGVLRGHFAFGFHHQRAAWYPDVHYVHRLIHQPATVAA